MLVQTQVFVRDRNDVEEAEKLGLDKDDSNVSLSKKCFDTDDIMYFSENSRLFKGEEIGITAITLVNGDDFCINISFDKFCAIYQNLTNIRIKVI